MEFSEEALTEAKRQIDSALRKTRKVIETLSSKEDVTRFKSQITLARRRVEAFEIASDLIQRELERPTLGERSPL